MDAGRSDGTRRTQRRDVTIPGHREWPGIAMCRASVMVSETELGVPDVGEERSPLGGGEREDGARDTKLGVAHTDQAGYGPDLDTTAESKRTPP